MVWPRVDKYHSHCHRCNIVFRDAQLTNGYCSECIMAEKEDNISIAKRSESKVVTKAATKLLSSLKEKGKDGQVMPVLMNTFFNELGGPDGVAKIMVEEFQKTRGINLSPDEAEVYEPNLTLRMHWIELISRIQGKVDVDKQLSVADLQEEDLESILSNIAIKVLLEDQAMQDVVISQAIADESVRKKLFYSCIRADSRLANEILSKGGLILEPSTTRPEEKSESKNIAVEEDYDPAANEYKE